MGDCLFFGGVEGDDGGGVLVEGFDEETEGGPCGGFGDWVEFGVVVGFFGIEDFGVDGAGVV